MRCIDRTLHSGANTFPRTQEILNVVRRITDTQSNVQWTDVYRQLAEYYYDTRDVMFVEKVDFDMFIKPHVLKIRAYVRTPTNPSVAPDRSR